MIWTWLVGKVSGISLKFWGYLAAFFALLAALAKVYSAGKSEAKTEAQEKTLDNVVLKNEVDSQVRANGADVARDDLRQHYTRD